MRGAVHEKGVSLMRRIRTAIVAIVAVAVLSLAASAGAQPDPMDTCPGAVKIDYPVDGTYPVSINGQSGAITIDVDEATNVFSFANSGDLPLWGTIVVKGGPAAMTFTYSPGVAAADGLHAPVNPSNGTYYGLSHACFYPAPAESGGGTE